MCFLVLMQLGYKAEEGENCVGVEEKQRRTRREFIRTL